MNPLNKAIKLSIIAIFILFANINANAKIKAYLSYYTFSTPDNKPYIEAHISVVAKSLKFKKNTSKTTSYNASVGITLLIKDGDKIVSADKFNLLSQSVLDTTNIDFALIDQKRIALANGKYSLELSIKDNNLNEPEETVKQNFEINFPDNKINTSDIILIESFTKSKSEDNNNRNGYKILPIVNNFIPTSIAKLSFYHEIYNTAKLSPNESFLLNYYLQNANSLNQLSTYYTSKKVYAKDVIITLSELDISLLPSGNYNLIIELRNKNNEIIASKSTFFQRSNKSLGDDLSQLSKINTENSYVSNMSKETLIDYIKSLTPISSNNEINYVKTLLANNDQEQMKQYLIYFWEKRYPGNAEQEWLKYKKQVDIVNEKFSSKFTRGYDTDRGVVYLKYGPPSNTRFNDFDNKAYPYEIWQYYKIQNFTNRRFVFFSPENIKNEMVLLHSNMFGERNDPNWKYKILARTMKYSDDENTSDMEYFGQRLEADFND